MEAWVVIIKPFDQIMEIWIIVSLIAMLASVGKVMLIKTCCRSVDSWWLMFAARMLPAILLLPLLFLLDFNILQPGVFWGATLAAAVLTIAASLLYIEAVKQGVLSVVTPLQATVPVFMMVCTWLVYDELPSLLSLLFMLMIVGSVSLVMYASVSAKNSAGKQRSQRALGYSLSAAALFGVSTVLDRVAIGAVSHGALVYTACWHWVTLGLLSIWLWRKRHQLATNVGLWRPAVAGYVLLALTAFLAQQYAVQASLALDNGVTYVKTIVMAHIVIAAAIGIYYFNERVGPGVWWANLLTLAGGVGLIWSI